MFDRPTAPEGEKALLKIVERKPKELPDRIPVRFYPNQLSVERSVTYNEQTPIGGTPVTQFGSSGARTLSMELFFDTYEQKLDVRTAYTNNIDRLMTASPEYKAPPGLQVIWGNLTEFKWVLKSAKKQFTMFLRGGTPVRARVSVTFQQYESFASQPTEAPGSSITQQTIRTVTEGETLTDISTDEYGDPGQWRRIADANGIVDPRTLQVGREIVVPPLESR